ncbi:MAG: amidohydrolase [Deltaproteobacteria bacterium]|nr:amidohydrolase [Deltaproteobacteria bacterium]
MTKTELGHQWPQVIIEGGILLTMVDGEAPVPSARVHVRDGRIVAIQAGKAGSPLPEGVEVLDAADSIIMPGLINAHSHAAMTLFRGFADDLPLNTWLFEKIFPAEAEYLDPRTVYWGSLLACLEMIASGTTTLSDGYFFQDSTVEAVHKAGLRAVLAQGVIDFPAPGVPDPKDNLKVGEEFLQRWLHFSDLITPGLFCHSPVTCTQRTLRHAMEISLRCGVPLQMHLSETRGEVDELLRRTGLRPVRYLENLGLLGEGLVAAHAIHLDGEEMELLARNSVKIVHLPESNMKLSSGVARIPDMLRAGLTVGLGTDGCASNNDLDLFQEMDKAAKQAKVFTMDPVSLDATTVLKMATSWGAKVLGIEKETGTLEVGKQADIIVVDLRSPHLTPLYSPCSTLVYSASGGDVRHVMVAGKLLMKERRLLGLDAEEIMARVREIARKIAP